jgi:hypothetical protein
VQRLRPEVLVVKTANSFVEFVRAGDWQSAMALVNRDLVISTLPHPCTSMLERLVESNAPSELVVSFLARCCQEQAINPNSLGLLELCMNMSSTKANALETFAALLDFGLSPNVLADGGATLLQRAIELNKTREVAALLAHGVDPLQMSVFGAESTTNIEEATLADNGAAKLVLQKFTTPK